MKIIYNNIIPFKGFKAINICGIVFVRKDVPRMTWIDYNHEKNTYRTNEGNVVCVFLSLVFNRMVCKII